MSVGDGTTTAGEENGKFCVKVVPVTRTAGILTYSVKALAIN